MIILDHKKFLGPLHCDKLSFTLSMKPSEHADVKKVIDKLKNDGHTTNVFSWLYSQSVNVGLGNLNANNLLIQIAPKQSKMSHMRVEFNPAKADMAEVRGYLDQIIDGGYDRLMAQGKCTRIDIAVDIHHAQLHWLLVWCHGLRVTANHYSQQGRLQTHYLGAKTSSRRLCIYDKRAQIKRHNSKAFIKEEMPEYPLTRIEMREQGGFPAVNIEGLPNPLADVCVATPRLMALYGEKMDVFLLAAQSVGVTAALQRLRKSTRKEMEKILRVNMLKCWNPQAMWAQWPKVAAAIVSPPKTFNLAHLKQ